MARAMVLRDVSPPDASGRTLLGEAADVVAASVGRVTTRDEAERAAEALARARQLFRAR